MTTAVGGLISGRVPFAPSLLSSAVVARLCRLPSFLYAFHATSSNKSQGTKGRGAKNPMGVLRMGVPPSLDSKIHRDRSVLGLTSQAYPRESPALRSDFKRIRDTTVKHTDTVI